MSSPEHSRAAPDSQEEIQFASGSLPEAAPAGIPEIELPAHATRALERIRCVLEHSLEKLGLDRSPFLNSGEHFENGAFSVRAFDWGHDWENDPGGGPCNLKWRDLEVRWYKHYDRGVSLNRELSESECAEMVSECLASLGVDHEKDGYFGPGSFRTPASAETAEAVEKICDALDDKLWYASSELNGAMYAHHRWESEAFETRGSEWPGAADGFNFKWRDFEARWCGMPGLGLSVNRELSDGERVEMLKQCLAAIEERFPSTEA